MVLRDGFTEVRSIRGKPNEHRVIRVATQVE